MKQILLLISITLLATACTNGESETSTINTESSISVEDSKKMTTKDFDAQVTFEIMDGQLKGTHVFKGIPTIKNQVFQIGVKKGPGYKEEVTKPGSLYVGSIDAVNPDYYLISLSKKFTGMIKQGSYPSDGSSAPLTIKNKNDNGPWSRAYGKLQTHNDITFTDVGDWLPIRGKREVRRVQGNFTDKIVFSYSSNNESIAPETVDVKVTFSIMETYRPNR